MGGGQECGCDTVRVLRMWESEDEGQDARGWV